MGPHPLQAPDQYPEAGRVEEPDLVQVDDELVAALADQVDEQLPESRRGRPSINNGTARGDSELKTAGLPSLAVAVG